MSLLTDKPKKHPQLLQISLPLDVAARVRAESRATEVPVSALIRRAVMERYAQIDGAQARDEAKTVATAAPEKAGRMVGHHSLGAAAA